MGKSERTLERMANISQTLIERKQNEEIFNHEEIKPYA
jgi:hypothetical protein